MSELEEIDALERIAEWRLRLHDSNPSDHANRTAADRLYALAQDLTRDDLGPLWAELSALCNWLAESDAISDYAELTADYRLRIGISETPRHAAEYLLGLLEIARSLT